jgi:hypothetical protein
MNALKVIVITLCFYPTFVLAKGLMTFSTIENSPYAAISENVMRVAYSRLKTDILISDFPAERSILTANTGMLDGELYRIKNVQLKYKNLIMVPIPIGKLEGIAITRNKSISIKKWEDLSNYQVCFRRGVKFAEAGLSNISARAVNSNKQLFTMLEQMRCEIIVIARITSIPLSIDLIKRQQVQLYQTVLQTYPLFHYLHKKNEHVAPQLTKVLKKMQQEGLIEKIRFKFIEKMTSPNGNHDSLSH